MDLFEELGLIRQDTSASFAAKRAKRKSLSNAARARRAELEQTFTRLSRPPQHSFRLDKLDVATLRPLVDLAYWSTFREVRRDAAAAFATLAMNEDNLSVLSEAGVLGALIALIGLNNETSDSRIHRDASTALAYLLTMDDVKLRFLKAPDGLSSLFYVCRSPSVDVRRAAAKALLNFSTMAATKEALVSSGGVKYLFNLTATNDERTRRRAAAVLKRLGAHEPCHDQICSDEHAVQSAVALLIDCNDVQIRRNMIDMLTSVASDDSRKRLLVESGVLTPLLMHLDPRHSSLETITMVIGCLHVLSTCSANLRAMFSEGLVQTLRRVLFTELGEIRQYRAMANAAAHSKSREEKMDKYSSGRSMMGVRPLAETKDPEVNTDYATWRSIKTRTPEELEGDALRYGLQILLNLSTHEPLRDDLVMAGIAEDLFDETILASSDKRVRRTTARILINLANPTPNPVERHNALIDAGILFPIRLYLTNKDFTLKTMGVTLAAMLASSPSARIELGCQPELLRLLINMCNPHDEEVNEWVAKALAELAADSSNFDPIISCGGLNALIYMICPRSKSKKVREDAVRCLASLSAHEVAKTRLTQSKALGDLISISKSGPGLSKLYATATLTNLEHDSAAIRIQTLYRGFASRRKERRRSISGGAEFTGFE